MKELIFDAQNLINRNYFVFKQGNPDISNFYDFFFQSIKKIANIYNTANIYLVWDKRLKEDSVGFRYEMTNFSYKGNRTHEHYDDMLQYQTGIINIAKCMGIKSIYPYTTEADDVIAWIAENSFFDNVVVSSDGDMLQLVNNKTTVYNLISRQEINKNNFESIVGVDIKHFLLRKCIMGDSSDNIPGIKGYGKVKATKLAKDLLSESGSIEKSPHREIIQNNVKLMSLHYAIDKLKEDCEIFKKQYNEHITKSKIKLNECCKFYNANYIRMNKDDFLNMTKVKCEDDIEFDIASILN